MCWSAPREASSRERSSKKKKTGTTSSPPWPTPRWWPCRKKSTARFPTALVIGTTDQHGRFTIRGLAPGSYTLYAWQDLDESVYRDADFLKSQEANGKAVKVEEGSDQQSS